ncbi:class I SAM-dependent rRNA methyltransferase [soil metagenome]
MPKVSNPPPGPAADPVIVNRRGAARLTAGHPWVYRSDVVSRPEAPRFAPVHDERGRPLGWAAVNPSSEIAVRRVHAGAEPVGGETLVRALDRALDHRERLMADPTSGIAGDEGVRLVHADADALPGLVVDRFGDVLVVQSASAPLEPYLGALVETLVARTGATGVLGRFDSSAREREGLTTEVRVLAGHVGERVAFVAGGLALEVDPWRGQKTGAFLDQRVNARRLAAYAHGRGLDVFSYGGGFGLRLARGADGAPGVRELELVDTSASALQQAAAAFERNGLPRPRLEASDAFARLRTLDAERRSVRGPGFDVISLDPPALAKRRRDLDRAYAGYKELNLRALKVLAPGGVLGTSSCSFHVSEEDFVTMLEDAAADAGRACRVLGRFGAAPDHPERLGFPESRYLTFVLLQAID